MLKWMVAFQRIDFYIPNQLLVYGENGMPTVLKGRS